MRGVALLAAAVLLTVPVRAAGQGVFDVSFQPGEVGVGANGASRAYGGGAWGGSTTLEEWLRLPLAGSLFNGRLLTWSVTLTPAAWQQSSSAYDDALIRRHLGLDLGASLFRGKLVSFNVSALRTRGREDGFGRTRDFATESLGGNMSLRSQYFPLTLAYNTRTTADRWVGGINAAPVERDEEVSRLRLSGQSSKLSLSLERVEYTDRIGGNDFTALEGFARHSARWGKGSYLFSTLGYLDRTGFWTSARWSWGERLHLQHTRTARSDLHFDQQTWSREGQPTRTRSCGIGTGLQVTSWLDAAVSTTRQTVAQADGGSVRTGVVPRLDFRAELPLDASFHGGASAGYERTSRDAREEVWVEVFEEMHTVPAGRSFLLTHPYADVGSVVVRSVGGLRTFDPATDYRVLDNGPYLRIQVAPGSRIEVGDTLSVDYRYRQTGPPESQTLSLGYTVTFAWAGVVVQHGRSERRETALDDNGGAGNVVNDMEQWVSLGTTRSTAIGQLNLHAERRSRQLRRRDLTTDEVRLALAFPRLSGVQTSVGASGTQARADGTTTRVLTPYASASWLATPALRFEGGVDGWFWSDEGGTSDRTLGARLGMNWQFARVEVLARYDYGRRFMADSERMEHRWSVRMVRRF